MCGIREWWHKRELRKVREQYLKRIAFPTKTAFTQEFRFAMEFAQHAIENQKTDKDRILMLNYILKVVKRDLQYDVLSTFLVIIMTNLVWNMILMSMMAKPDK